MASPVKAFIDPTSGPLRMSPCSVPGSMRPVAPCGVNQFAYLRLPKPPVFNLQLLVRMGRGESVTNTVRSKVPPPPMGRLMLITFPPIYRERPKDENATGQIFPAGYN